MDAALVVPPEVPVKLMLYDPGVAELLATKVNKLVVVGLALAELSCAVTPLGIPLTTRFTLLLKPLAAVTATVLFTPEPPLITVTALGDDVIPKLGAVIVSTIVAVRLSVPEVPVTPTE